MGGQWAVSFSGCIVALLLGSGPEGVTLEISVQSMNGQKAIAGAELIVERLYATNVEPVPTEDPNSRVITRAESNEQGKIVLRELPAVPMRLTLRADGYVSPVIEALKGREIRHQLDLRLPRAIDVAGTVVDDAGKPVPDVNVDLVCAVDERGREAALLDPLSTKTDADGGFRIARAPEGLVRFNVTAGGLALDRREATQPTTRPVQLTLRRTSVVRVNIDAPQHLRGQYRIKVEAKDAAGGLTKVDELPGADRGTITFVDVPVGTSVVSAWIPTRRDVAAPGPLTATVDVKLGQVTEVRLVWKKEP